METNVATRTILYLSMLVAALAAVYVVLAYKQSVYEAPPEPDVTIPA